MPSVPALLLSVGCAGLAGGTGESAPDQDWLARLGMEMIDVEPGTFTMGNDGSQVDAHSGDTPAHDVTLTHGFSIGRTEVTQVQWRTIMGEWEFGSATECDGCAADNLSWYDAASFLNRLSKADDRPMCYHQDQEGVVSIPGGPLACSGYRLPTEAEWEYAARAGTDDSFAGSDDAASVAWTLETSGSAIHEPCELAPNAWDICDMSGNVFEWTSDGWSTYAAADVTDPFIPMALGSTAMAARGGGFLTYIDVATVTARGGAPAFYKGSALGFRVAVSRLPADGCPSPIAAAGFAPAALGPPSGLGAAGSDVRPQGHEDAQ